MHDKTKVVEVAGVRWQVRRMTPAVGSYIWQRLMAATIKMQVEYRAPAQPQDPVEEKRMREAMEAATPDQRLRTACGVAFMNLSYEDLQFIQTASLRVLSNMQSSPNGVDTPMPVMQDDGRGLLPLLEDDPALVTQLTVEVLAFNLVSFLQPTAASPAEKAATA